MLAVLLLCLSWELVGEELDGVHRRDERVHVVLCKVAAAYRAGRIVSGGGGRAAQEIALHA